MQSHRRSRGSRVSTGGIITFNASEKSVIANPSPILIRARSTRVIPTETRRETTKSTARITWPASRDVA